MRPYVAGCLTAAVPFAAFAVFYGYAAWTTLSEPSCSSADLALIPTLESQPVINARPETAADAGYRSDCDYDEGYTYADHYYTTGDTLAGAVVPYYAGLARADGWAPVDGNDATRQCYGKKLGAAHAFLLVSINGAHDYSVSVSGTHTEVPPDGGLMC